MSYPSLFYSDSVLFRFCSIPILFYSDSVLFRICHISSCSILFCSFMLRRPTIPLCSSLNCSGPVLIYSAIFYSVRSYHALVYNCAILYFPDFCLTALVLYNDNTLDSTP